MHNTPNAPVNVLWTSGWDSTYRVADLLLVQGRIVQPWYVMDSGRMSTGREMRTMHEMWEMFSAKDPSARERLRPTRVFTVSEIPEDAEITAAYRRLADRNQLGQQYDWLARLAKSENTRLELSIHADDKFRELLGNETMADENGVHFLSPGVDNPVFERFAFPVLNLSKLDMQTAAAEHGFADIMECTWFCFTPLLDGKPCGFCNPCKYARDEGLGRRVPAPTLSRQLQVKALNKAWKARNKVIQALDKVPVSVGPMHRARQAPW